MGWRGRWEGGSGWGTHVRPWLIHLNVWQKPPQYCKVINLQLKKIFSGPKKIMKLKTSLMCIYSLYIHKEFPRRDWNACPKVLFFLFFFSFSVSYAINRHEPNGRKDSLRPWSGLDSRGGTDVPHTIVILVFNCCSNIYQEQND